MIFLIFAIICASSFSILFRILQQHGANIDNAMLFNYLTGALFALGGALWGNGNIKDADGLFPGIVPCITAVGVGFLFVGGFVAMNLCTKNCGVALTSICARSAMVIPIVFSWVLLGDSEPVWPLIALVLAAVTLISFPSNKSKTSSSRAGATLSLVILFLVFGTSDFLVKVLNHQISASGSMVQARLSVATSLIFVTAFAYSLVKTLVKGTLKTTGSIGKDILFGILMGLANSGTTLMTVHALSHLSAAVFFPIFNTATITLCFLCGVLHFKERPAKIQIGGLVLALVAIVLLFIC